MLSKETESVSSSAMYFFFWPPILSCISCAKCGVLRTVGRKQIFQELTQVLESTSLLASCDRSKAEYRES